MKDVEHHVFGEMKIKTMRYHCTPIEKAKIRTLVTNADKDVEQQEILLIANRNEKWYCHFERNLLVTYETKHSYHNIQSLHNFIQPNFWKYMPTQKHEHGCLQQLNALHQVSGEINCAAHRLWSIIQHLTEMIQQTMKK